MIDTSTMPAVWYNAMVLLLLKDSKESLESLEKLRQIHESRQRNEDSARVDEAGNSVEGK